MRGVRKIGALRSGGQGSLPRDRDHGARHLSPEHVATERETDLLFEKVLNRLGDRNTVAAAFSSEMRRSLDDAIICSTFVIPGSGWRSSSCRPVRRKAPYQLRRGSELAGAVLSAVRDRVAGHAVRASAPHRGPGGWELLDPGAVAAVERRASVMDSGVRGRDCGAVDRT